MKRHEAVSNVLRNEFMSFKRVGKRFRRFMRFMPGTANGIARRLGSPAVVPSPRMVPTVKKQPFSGL
jgi:hypothetical protein